MRQILSLLLFALAQSVLAGPYEHYYRQLPVSMPEAQAPVIPDRRVSVTDFGGKGDGITLNTRAFSDAVKALDRQGGGHLDVPEGIFLTGPIVLKDNIDLHLAKNAMLLFTPDKSAHVRTDKETGKREDRAVNAISASKRHDISITGEGTIDGNGKYWRPVKRAKVSDVEWKDFLQMGGTVSEDGSLWYPAGLKHFDDLTDSPEKTERLRAHLIRLTDCERVLVQGVTIQNAPRFHLIPTRCDNVIIDGVTVRCPWNAQNGDAIDISSCKNVLIVGNTVDAGDDGICMKAGAGESGLKAGPCENILIQDNTVYHAHGGFVIGSEFSGGMKNIVVRHNTFSGTDTGLRFKSAVKRGGKTGNIFIDHIIMNDIRGEAIVFETTYWDNHVGAKQQQAPQKEDFLPDFSDIHISHVVCRECKTAISAHGTREMIHDIDIRNAVFFYNQKDKDIDKACDIRLEDVTFETFTPRR